MAREREWESLLAALTQLEAAGAPLDWQAFYSQQPGTYRRVPLPTYPYQRQSYWLGPARGQAQLPTTATALTPSHQDDALPSIEGWVHRPVWRETASSTDGKLLGRWLLVTSDPKDDVALSACFPPTADSLICAQIGDQFLRVDQQRYFANLSSTKDMESLFHAAQASDSPLAGILFVPKLEPQSDSVQQTESGLNNVDQLRIALQAAAIVFEQPLDFLILTRGAQKVRSDDIVTLSHAGLWGFGRCAAKELSRIRVRLCDLDASKPFADIASAIAGDDEPQTAYRAGRRHAPESETVSVDALPERPLVRGDGVYLVTGGAGAVGTKCAMALIQQGARKLAICGRSSAACISQLQTNGATVRYYQADLRDSGQVGALIAAIHRDFGALHGIVHAAGVLQDRLLLNLSGDDLSTVWNSKAASAALLCAATQSAPLDFFVGVSSLAAIAGNVGQANYAAANATLDAICQAEFVHARCRMTLNFGPWHGAGMNSNAALANKWSLQGLETISADRGAQLLDWSFTHPADQWCLFPANGAAVWPRQYARNQAPDLRKAPTKETNSVSGSIIELVSATVAEVVNASPERLPLDSTFRELGIDSLMADEIARRLQARIPHLNLSATQLFEHPTIRALSARLSRDAGENSFQHSRQDRSLATSAEHPADAANLGNTATHDIAVIGYACRFPGANNTEEFWRLLSDRRSAIAPIPEDRWRIASQFDPSIAARLQRGKLVGGFLDKIDEFDPRFFRISPYEARSMDPRQRLLLEVAYHCAEHAGYGGAALRSSRTGVFAGSGAHDYLAAADPGDLGEHAATGGTAAGLPARLAYHLDLRGPLLTIDTACSSSLVALSAAVASLRSGQCEMAFAAGAHLNLRFGPYYALSRAGALSPTKTSAPFDRRADGFLPGEGIVVLLLRPLADAVRAGDAIYGVIKGVAVNSDGATNGLTAPNPQAQAQLLFDAWSDARIDPVTISHIEAHGTGTALGDPIELSALETAFTQQTGRKQFCAVGSAKPNIGHADAASGLAGVLKVLLSLRHGRLPALPDLSEPNPRFAIETSAITLLDRTRAWPATPLPRRAGVSSFGFTGTNAHVVLESAPSAPVPRNSPDDVGLLLISALSASALRRLLTEYQRWATEAVADWSLADACFTAAVGRAHQAHRVAIVATSASDLIESLDQAIGGGDRPTLASIYRSPQDEAESRQSESDLRRLAQLLPTSVLALANDLCGGELATRAMLVETVSPLPPANSAERKLLSHLLAALYAAGTDVDWQRFYAGQERRRIALPLYPYERQSYWLNVDSNGDTTNTKADGSPSHDLHQLMREPVWERLAPHDHEMPSRLDGRYLLLHDESGFSDRLATELERRGAQLLHVRFGDTLNREAHNAWRANYQDPDQIRGLLSRLSSEDCLPSTVVDARSVRSPGCELAAADSAAQLLILTQALSAVRGPGIDLWIITTDSQHVLDSDDCRGAQQAALWGMGLVINREIPRLRCRCVDLALRELATGEVVSDLAEWLAKPPANVEIAIRNRSLYSRGHVAIEPRADQSTCVIQRGGVYLITGGRGGIGSELAKWLRERFDARVILMGRSQFAAREWLEDAHICGVSADVTDPTQLRAALDGIRRRFGRLDGVFHAAGVLTKNAIHAETKQSLNLCLAPKATGAQVLIDAIVDQPVDFLVFFSSVAGVTGNIFQAGYSAANRVLDSKAHYARSRGVHAISIAWDAWRDVGMGAAMAPLLAERDESGLSTGECLAALEHALTTDRPNLTVARDSLAPPTIRPEAKVPQTAPSPSADLAHEDHRVAQWSIEQLVETELCAVLGMAKASYDRGTTFMDAGLDSMLAAKLVKRLSAALGQRLAATLPFDFPTIDQLAQHLATKSDAPDRWPSPLSYDYAGESVSSTISHRQMSTPHDGTITLRSGRRAAPVARYLR
ncbi:MAG: SDR family NAD(P)-dependent oxidoreductase [Pirellulales bacterium]|nr:SDR family NAD(P)-dependent oxidoreductase [Pirellulales bacterium]